MSAALSSRISTEHTFDFVDAEVDCPPAPGVGEFYPGPYAGWFPSYEPSSVKQIQDNLRQIIEEDGPYDGVIGFSEGAALAAGLLLSDEYFHREPTFKVAIFFNSVMVFSPSEMVGDNISPTVKTHFDKFSSYLHSYDDEPSSPDCISPDIWGFTTGSDIRISVPTLHVIGSADVFCDTSRELAKLCSNNSTIMIHDGGHELPRGEAYLARCGELFESTVSLGLVAGA